MNGVQIATALVATVALAGCAPHWQFSGPPGATNEDLQRAFAGCRLKAAESPVAANPSFYGAAIEESIIRNCMRAKGYVEISGP